MKNLIKNLTICTVVSVGALTLTVSTSQAQNLLADPGFELQLTAPNPNPNGVAGWANFGGATFLNTPLAHSGQWVLDTPDNGGGYNVPGSYQDFAASAGETFTFSGWVYTPNVLPANGNDFAILQLSFYTGAPPNNYAGGTGVGPAVVGGISGVPQPVAAPLTRAAIFLVATLNPGSDHRATVRSFCGDFAALLRAVEFRDLEGGLSCVMGFGSEAWDRLFGPPRPAMLHPFREIRAGARHAVSTPGDLLFHIRAKRMDLCFELATQIMARIGDAVSPADEVQGFRYFDDRDLLGFVDGTENPRGEAAIDAVLVGEEDAAFAGGSYVIVQKYLHDLDGWNALSTEAQERIIGRTKLVGY